MDEYTGYAQPVFEEQDRVNPQEDPMGDSLTEKTLKAAKDLAGDLQPWPEYFESKARELKTILGFYDFGSVNSILEIGCGNGFTACLLAGKAKSVQAFDLPLKNAVSHSIGINAAAELVRKVGIGNVGVTGGSVEDIPFKDGSFDVIFSEYALQYVKDKKKALEEMRRVLDDRGVIITVVPNFIERIFVPLVKCQYILKRLLLRIVDRNAKVNGGLPGTFTGKSSRERSGKLRKIIDDYLSLKPDGAYKSFTEELFRHFPGAWKKLMEDNGFRVVDTFSTQMVPLGLFELLGSPGARFISGKMHRINRILGKLPLLKNAGYSIGLVAVKR